MWPEWCELAAMSDSSAVSQYIEADVPSSTWSHGLFWFQSVWALGPDSGTQQQTTWGSCSCFSVVKITQHDIGMHATQDLPRIPTSEIVETTGLRPKIGDLVSYDSYSVVEVIMILYIALIPPSLSRLYQPMPSSEYCEWDCSGSVTVLDIVQRRTGLQSPRHDNADDKWHAEIKPYNRYSKRIYSLCSIRV